MVQMDQISNASLEKRVKDYALATFIEVAKLGVLALGIHTTYEGIGKYF